MAYLIVNLASEYLPDGSLHVYSPEVPGFHVIEQDPKKSHQEVFLETALPVLQDTMTRRVVEANVGKNVRLVADTPLLQISNFVPEELRRRVREERPVGIPRQLIAEIT